MRIVLFFDKKSKLKLYLFFNFWFKKMRIVLFCFLLVLLCLTVSPPTMAFSLFKSKTTTPSPYRSNDVRSRTTTKPSLIKKIFGK
uniref:Uncharacterized protein n=1 Tax=Panagrolaimus sp. PS1159 TaxID=55785 RepID=A0AC35H059_9BILA